MAKTKISVVRYLNALPLAWGILKGIDADAFECILSTPAECADQLARGAVDIGLIPSIEFQRIQGTRIVPGPVIACRHRVRSVLLVSTLPLWKVRTVATDEGSRSSVILAKIVFESFYRARPEFVSAEPDLAAMLAGNDAALIIGDTALKFMEEHERPDAEKQRSLLKAGAEPLYVFDLVERWKFLTGLPFVFAFWAVRPGYAGKEIAEILRSSREYGMQHIADIAEEYSGPLGIRKESIERYLRENVHYYMDSDCAEGLRLFYRKAAKLGFIKSQRSVEFV